MRDGLVLSHDLCRLSGMIMAMGWQRLRPLVPPGDRHPKLLVLDVNGLLVHRVFLDGGQCARGRQSLYCIMRLECRRTCSKLIPIPVRLSGGPRQSDGSVILCAIPGGGHAHPRLSPAWTYGQFAVFERPHARDFLQ